MTTCGNPAIIPNTQGSLRIVGGDTALPFSWPWQSIYMAKNTNLTEKDRKGECGAVLIYDQWALTAAHCKDVYKYVLLPC